MDHVDLHKMSFQIGLVLVVFHSILAVAFIFFIDLPEDINFKDVNLPIATVYIVAFLSWGFKQVRIGAMPVSHQSRSIPALFAWVIWVIILVSMAATLVAVYQATIFVDADGGDYRRLNGQFVAIEAFFGACFSLIMSELFGYQRDDQRI